MTINTQELIAVAQQLCEVNHLKATISESTKGACIIGGSALTGSLLGGPVGLFLGGIMGSVLAFSKAQGKYTSVANVIMNEMTPEQRTQLAESIRNVVKDVNAEDGVMLMGIIMQNSSLQGLVLGQITKYLSNEMGYAISS